MTVYIALLRSINICGKNIIKMADLKPVFESLGLCEVKTYIQSGNVIFKSNDSEESLCNKIEHEIECIDVYRSESDKDQVIGREVYLLFRQSIRNSKLANNLYKLNVPTTVHNWKTLSKLNELAKTMEI